MRASRALCQAALEGKRVQPLPTDAPIDPETGRSVRNWPTAEQLEQDFFTALEAGYLFSDPVEH